MRNNKLSCMYIGVLANIMYIYIYCISIIIFNSNHSLHRFMFPLFWLDPLRRLDCARKFPVLDSWQVIVIMTHFTTIFEVTSNTPKEGWITAATLIDGTNRREKSMQEDKKTKDHEHYRKTLFESLNCLLEVPWPK